MSRAETLCLVAIGKGQIIVRDNPGQDLSGLNRDTTNAMQVETMPDVNVNFNPFSFVDTALDSKQNTDQADQVLKFFYNPVDFFKEKFGGKKEKQSQPPTKPTAEAPKNAEGTR